MKKIVVKEKNSELAREKFYTFSQNNSGGTFDVDEKRGIAETVIVEAYSADEANSRAEQIGLYFDGEGDCPCCGNRWTACYSDNEGTDVPSFYGTPIEQLEPSWYRNRFFIHMLDGSVIKAELAEEKPKKKKK